YQKSGPDVFVEPVDCALPGQISRRFVVSFRRCIAIEAVDSRWVDVAFVRNVCGFQGYLVRRPGRRQSRIELPVMDQNRGLDLCNIVLGWRAAVEWRCRRYVGSQAD